MAGIAQSQNGNLRQWWICVGPIHLSNICKYCVCVSVCVCLCVCVCVCVGIAQSRSGNLRATIYQQVWAT
jgi:hypothetical protein